ncbi:PepSY domain-containing protein [Pelomonas sp. CA6]|uniref:PepSY-associated TM helix domain-containing protein n=1 Tax=Pelomonas sp. CA6 TaxID=2907999 RepID=UPI001F4C2E91|nr:PepSY-associated TM helix domain-containing protein [Pelomonas sp. CA6]MCH7343388.1 PepSY domain-containing protein [Pelomonas sp. CA6]
MRPDGAKEGLRQSMAWLHTWAGLLLGWLLFAIFVTGTLSFFRHEISLWMKPELRGLGAAHAGTPALAERWLRAHAPQAQNWTVRLPDAREPALRVSWREPAARPGERPRFETRWLDPASGAELRPRPTFGGDFFYRFHFELRSAEKSRWILEGRWVVGLATLAMFVALLSGIVTHRRLFADFFTLRWAKGGQRAWLDAHNVSGVLALPFYLLITFSGLMIFHSLYLPAGIAAAYGMKDGAYFSDLAGEPAGSAMRGRGGARAATPAPGPMPPLALQAALDQARHHWPDLPLESLSVQRDGPEGLRLELRARDGGRLQYPPPRLVLDGRDGRLLHAVDRGTPATRVYGVLYGLHMARFADWGLRWTLFALGVLGSAMIATGLLLWRVKRRAQTARRAARASAGERLVDALNIASLAGLALALCAYLLANRLLPAQLPQRMDAELQAFFGAWGLALLWALWQPTRATWRRLLALAATGLAALPLLGAASGAGHLLDDLAHGEHVRALVELGWLVAAALLGALAWHLREPRAARRATATPPGDGEARPC